MISLDSAIKHAPLLIAGNDPASLAVFEKAFLDAGYRNIKTTSDLREVRPLFQRWKFDLVIMDVFMPGLGSFDVMEDLRGPIRDDGLAVIAIVNSEDRIGRQKLLDQGARDFISKPFDRGESLGRIKTILENKILFARHQMMMETGSSAEAT
ncbi:MAG: response regulator [Rhodospirillales bacterium]|nr:response regulator [Rhodospirillales bacterium]